MSCLKRILQDISKAELTTQRLALEAKCNFVIVAFNNKIYYDKESCWIRDGKVGQLIKLIKYEDFM